MIAVATYKHGDWLSGQTLSGQIITGQFCGYSMSGMPRLDIGNGADRALMVINDSVTPATPPIAESVDADLPPTTFEIGDRARITELGGRSQKWLNQIVEILAIEREGRRVRIKVSDPETGKPYTFLWNPDWLEKVGELATGDSAIATLTTRINNLSSDMEQALKVERNAANSALLLAKELGNELLSLKAQVKRDGGKWEAFRNTNLKISSSRASLCQRIFENWEKLERLGVKSLNQADQALRPPKQSELANPQTSAEIDTEEVEQRGELIGDLVPPVWAELKALYSQIGTVKDWRGGIAVESERWAFTAVFRTREEAWQKWQGKYRALLDRQTTGQAARQEAPESSPVEELEPDKAIDNEAFDDEPEIMAAGGLVEAGLYPAPEKTKSDRGIPVIDDSGLAEVDPVAEVTELVSQYGLERVLQIVRLEAETLGVDLDEYPAPKKTKNDRVEHDYYPTPDPITEALLQIVDIKGQVFDPCDGTSAISKFFYGAITNEPYPQEGCQPDYQADASNEEIWRVVDEEGGFDWSVFNPPYGLDLPVQILAHALKYARVGVAVLLRISFLEPCRDRAEWMTKNSDQLRYIIPVNPRPQFRADIKGGDCFTVAWFVYEKAWSWQAQEIDCPFKFITDWKGE